MSTARHSTLHRLVLAGGCIAAAYAVRKAPMTALGALIWKGLPTGIPLSIGHILKKHSITIFSSFFQNNNNNNNNPEKKEWQPVASTAATWLIEDPKGKILILPALFGSLYLIQSLPNLAAVIAGWAGGALLVDACTVTWGPALLERAFQEN